MKNIYSRLSLIILVVLAGCAKSIDKTEIFQKDLNIVCDVHSQVKEILNDDVLIGSNARPVIMQDYLIIGDYKSPDKLIHIFNKKDFKYLVSTADLGQGPDEITGMGNIATDEGSHKFYVSDHGKQKIFSYDIDSVLANPDYKPTVKVEMNASQFPDRYKYLNDTLSYAILIEPTNESTFKQSVVKWNMLSNTFTPIKYNNPEIKKPRMSFAVSVDKGLLVECYTYHDLITICNLSGELVCNIYGPLWDNKVSNRIHHFGDVAFCKDKIVALYSGGDNSTNEYYPTKFIVFNLDGSYVKTLDVGYKIMDFCYDEDEDRIIMNCNDEFQFAYLDLKGLI